MNNDIVLVSLITALSGLGGALIGAGGAVLGPWWLARSQRRVDAEAEFLEKRRSAIVEFFDAETHLTVGMEAGRDVADRTARSNTAFTALISLLQKGESRVDLWLRWLRGVAGSPTMDSASRMAYQSWGEKMLLEWHRGDLALSGLKKFELRVEKSQMWLVREEDL